LWTSTRTPTAGSTREISSIARVAWKNDPPAPPCASQRRDHRRVERLALVHLARERAEAGLGELADAVAEEPLVLGERRKRKRRGKRRVDRLGHGLRGIMA
jgi:hypothetical protein